MKSDTPTLFDFIKSKKLISQSVLYHPSVNQVNITTEQLDLNMSNVQEKQQNLFDGLASLFPTTNIRDSIRKYNYFPKANHYITHYEIRDLIETLNYLGRDYVSQLTKPVLVKKLILRLQVFLNDSIL